MTIKHDLREMSLRLDPERCERLRQLAFRLRISKQQALLQALDGWMAKMESELIEKGDR